MNIGFLKNDEYKGFFNACKRIYSEEGFMAFYRGYNAYMLAVKLTHFVLISLIDSFLDECASLRNRFHDDENATYW